MQNPKEICLFFSLLFFSSSSSTNHEQVAVESPNLVGPFKKKCGVLSCKILKRK